MSVFRIFIFTFLSSLFLLSQDALAANAANGKKLYVTTPNNFGVPLSNCADSTCHTSDPSANIRLKGKCTSSAVTCVAAITAASNGGVGAMGIFSNMTSTNTTDIAAYMVNPNAPAVIGVSATSLTFSATAINANAPAQTIMVSNNGLANLTVSAATLGGTNPGDFTATNNCSAAVVPGNTCTISVGFKPTVSGARSATLAIVSNGGNQSVTLNGSGSGSPTVSLNGPVGGLAYPDTTIGATPALANNMPGGIVTLTNSGSGALTISSISTSTDFIVDPAGTCKTGSLAAGQNCTLIVKFSPTAPGARTGSLTIAHNAAASPATIALKGNGLATIKPAATLSPASLDFGNVQVGTSSALQSVTLHNGGGKVLTITAIQQTGSSEFVRGGTCLAGQVAAGSSCTIDVTFTPSSALATAKTAAITVVDDAGDIANSQQTLNLSGIGTSGVIAAPSIAPASLDFGSQGLNTSSTTKISTITNGSSTDVLSITALTIIGSDAADFAMDVATVNACSTTTPVPPSGSCDVVVTFTPTNAGALSANVAVTTNAAGSPHGISLSGSGSSASPTPISNSPATNLGGGGCVLDPSARFEPTLGLLLFLALMNLATRRARLQPSIAKNQSHLLDV